MSFITRHLEPEEILAELLFGLIMVLTFTLGASLAGGHERGLLLAATGCNVAWGVIDAALFVMSIRYARRRRGRLVQELRAARDEDAALAAIRDEFEFDVNALTRAEDREQLYRSIHQLFARAEPQAMSLRRGDLLSALAVFVLVVTPALPAALPFLVVTDPHLALRLSNALLLALLFVAGWRWGRHVQMRPWASALVVTTIGLLLVVVAIALGG